MKVLLHKHRQLVARRTYRSIMPEFGTKEPVDAVLSLELETELLRCLAHARDRADVAPRRFDDVPSAVQWLIERGLVWTPANGGGLSSLLVVGQAPGGFFAGLPSIAEFEDALGQQVESATFLPFEDKVVVLIDVATEDPQHGNFVDVEVFPIPISVWSILTRVKAEMKSS